MIPKVLTCGQIVRHWGQNGPMVPKWCQNGTNMVPKLCQSGVVVVVVVIVVDVAALLLLLCHFCCAILNAAFRSHLG